MNKRVFIPQTESILWESEENIVSLGPSCAKPENHEEYRSLPSLGIEALPTQWQDPSVLEDIKMVSRRVVHLTVVELSPVRRSASKRSHTGTGFLTVDPNHGAIVHTSKHVVFDPYEAERTIVHLFFDCERDRSVRIVNAKAKLRDRILSRPCGRPSGDTQPVTSGLFLSRGSSRYFRSVMCSDYTVFACEMPLQELFTPEELTFSRLCFSWRMSGLRRVLLAPQTDLDVAIISHPHGWPKKISFGKMTRLTNIHPSLYTAPTCSGSSGAPVIRLHADSGHYLTAGQFVHHGFNRYILDMGMATVRPPVTFPYWAPLDTEHGLASAISLLYEPVFYWTLFVCDMLHITSTLQNVLDVFAYTSSLSAFFLSGESWLFRFLFTCFWLHICVSTGNAAWRAGLYFAICNLIRLLISMSAFFIGWFLLFFMPWPISNMFVVSFVWLIAIYAERHFSLAARFSMRTMGSFTEIVQYRLATELGVKSRQARRADLDTTEST